MPPCFFCEKAPGIIFEEEAMDWGCLEEKLGMEGEEFGSPPPEFLDPNANPVANDNDAYRSVSYPSLIVDIHICSLCNLI